MELATYAALPIINDHICPGNVSSSTPKNSRIHKSLFLALRSLLYVK